MATSAQVMATIGQQAVAAINGYGISPPTNIAVFVGWPTFDDQTKIINAKEALVSVFQLPGMRRTNRLLTPASRILWALASPAIGPVALVATISANQITFSGTVSAGINIHTILKGGFNKTADAYYQTGALDTYATIAIAVAGAINALALSGVSASASGPTVTVTGVPILKVNMGQGTVIPRIVQQTMRRIEVIAWVWDPLVRSQMADAIESNVATIDQPFLTTADGTSIYIRLRDSYASDDLAKQSLYLQRIVYDVEYVSTQSTIFTPVGVTQETISPKTASGQTLPSYTLTDGG
jgi:hypothetical protein